MKTDFYITLLIKKWKDELSPSESSKLSDWLNASADNRALAEEMEAAWKAGEWYHLPFPLDEQKDFGRMWQKIENEKDDSKEKMSKSYANGDSIRPKRFRILAVAASLAMLLAVGWWQFGEGSKATEMVLVTEAKLRQLTLPDGSKVWLNKYSQLQYPKEFEGEERLVKLEGEAFFDIIKDSTRPFRIATNDASVIVLGTSFNVEARSGKYQVEVSVQAGRVRLQSQSSKKFIELIPNQRGIYDVNTDSLQTLPDENLNAFAWQRRRLDFKDTPLKNVTETLANFYKTEIQVTGVDIQNCPFSGRFNTERRVESILNEIKQVLNLEVENTESGFILKGDGCK